MGKTHDDDEVEIDLRELYYALKKRVLVILAAVLAILLDNSPMHFS